MKSTNTNVAIIKLIIRSKDVGDGWRNVSPILVSLITDFDDQTLLETKSDADGKNFMVRLSEKGKIVAPYL